MYILFQGSIRYYADGFYPASNFFGINETTGDVYVKLDLKQDTVARELYRVGHCMILGPEVIKLFSCSPQLRLKFVLLINLKLLTIANSVLLNTAEHENFSANKYENANYCWHFHIYWQRKFHAQFFNLRVIPFLICLYYSWC